MVEGADGLTGICRTWSLAGRWQGKEVGPRQAGRPWRDSFRASLNDGPVATANAAGLMVAGQFLVPQTKHDNCLVPGEHR